LKQVALLLSKRNQFSYAARPVASARRAACRVTHRRLLRLAQARRRLLHLRRMSGYFGTSRGLSRDSSSITSPHASSSSTTSPMPRVRVPRHIARLVTRLVVDYFTSRRLVVDYFACTARPGASARRAARRRLLRLAPARCRLLHLRRALIVRLIARLVTRLVVDYFASRRIVVDYFTYVVRPVASAHHTACRMTPRRLLHLAQARLRLLHLRRASGCFGTSHGSSLTTSPHAGSSSTTSPTSRVWLLRHVAWLVA
jgi:hypothetical protein